MLDALEWKDTDGNGIREDGAGNPIAFTLITNDGNSVRERAAAIIQEGMRSIGLDVELQIIDFEEIVTRLVATYEWEALVIGFGDGPDPYSGISFWHSSGDFHLWHPNQPQPATAWEAEIDALYTVASQELDHEERVRLYHRAQEIAVEQVPVIYTGRTERISAMRNEFGNVTPTLYGLWDDRYIYRTDR